MKQRPEYRFNHTSGIILVTMLTLSMGWVSCRFTERIFKPADLEMPASFSNTASADTATATLPVWSEYFTDSNLVRLINAGLHNNYDLRMAQQKVEMARANVLLNKSALAPVVNAGVAGSNIRYGRHTMDGAGNATTPEVPYPIVPNYSLGLSSSWEIDIWGKLHARKRAAQLRYLSSEMGRNLVITSMVAELAYRYFELVSRHDQLDIIERNIKLQEEALEVVIIQKEAGRATQLAVRQFSAQLASTRSMGYGVRQEIKRLENEINFLAGRRPVEVETTSSIFNELLPTELSAGVPASMLARRPDIIQAELELQASHADVAAARAAFLPSLAITANAGFATFYPRQILDPASLAYGLVGSATAPLLNRKTFKAAYRKSVAGNRYAWYNYGKTAMGAMYEVRTTLSSLDNLQKQYLYNEQQANELADAIDISKDLYLAGYANYLEVITAQKNAVEAELKLVDTRKQLFHATVNLYRALGGGWN